jgi:hypothetical protein
VPIRGFFYSKKFLGREVAAGEIPGKGSYIYKLMNAAYNGLYYICETVLISSKPPPPQGIGFDVVWPGWWAGCHILYNYVQAADGA